MRFLLQPTGADRTRPVDAARAAREAGLDGVLLPTCEELPDPLLAASFAAAVPDVLLAAEVDLGRGHPLEVAEEALVADQSCGGRLVLVARPVVGARDRYEEALDLLAAATAARPFSFAGPTWTVPARLPENTDAGECLVRVTPPPARVRLEVWCAGVAPEVACRRGLGHLADPAGSESGCAHPETPIVAAPRARREDYGEPEALVDRLRAARASHGQDWAVVRAPAAAAAEIGSRVRPSVQLERLPEGLEEHWRGVWETRRRSEA